MNQDLRNWARFEDNLSETDSCCATDENKNRGESHKSDVFATDSSRVDGNLGRNSGLGGVSCLNRLAGDVHYSSL